MEHVKKLVKEVKKLSANERTEFNILLYGVNPFVSTGGDNDADDGGIGADDPSHPDAN